MTLNEPEIIVNRLWFCILFISQNQVFTFKENLILKLASD